MCASNAYARKRRQSVQRGNTYINVKTRNALFSTRPTSEIPVPARRKCMCIARINLADEGRKLDVWFDGEFSGA